MRDRPFVQLRSTSTGNHRWSLNMLRAISVSSLEQQARRVMTAIEIKVVDTGIGISKVGDTFMGHDVVCDLTNTLFV